MAEKVEVKEFVPHTESVAGVGDCTWYSVPVPGVGMVAVLSLDEPTAERLARLAYRRAVGKVGYAINQPNADVIRVRQEAVCVQDFADELCKDAIEYKRRDGLNYSVR